MQISGRLKTILGGLASLLLVIGILNYQMGVSGGANLSKPTTVDAGPQGLEALSRWLPASGHPIQSHRARFDSLNAQAGQQKSLLVVSWPFPVPARSSELEHLKTWITEGNSILVLLASLDQPRWAMAGSLENRDEFFSALGLDFDYSDDVDDCIDQNDLASDSEATMLDTTLCEITSLDRIEIALKPVTNQPIFGTVNEVITRQYPQLAYSIAVDTKDSQTRLWPVMENANGDAALYHLGATDADHGDLWISRYAEIASNAVIGKGDNRHLILGIVERTVSGGGSVVFDDYHFGLSDLYDPDAFYSDPRLHRTLGLLGVLWLLWLAGRSTRLAPLQRKTQAVSVKSLVEATAGLYARMLTPRMAGQAMLEHFMRDMKKRFRVDSNGDLWSALANHVGENDRHVTELHESAKKIDAGRKLSLKKLSETIYAVRHQVDSR